PYMRHTSGAAARARRRPGYNEPETSDSFRRSYAGATPAQGPSRPTSDLQTLLTVRDRRDEREIQWLRATSLPDERRDRRAPCGWRRGARRSAPVRLRVAAQDRRS